MLWVGRGVVIIVAVIAYFIASSKAEGAQAIMEMVENAWGGLRLRLRAGGHPLPVLAQADL